MSREQLLNRNSRVGLYGGSLTLLLSLIYLALLHWNLPGQNFLGIGIAIFRLPITIFGLIGFFKLRDEVSLANLGQLLLAITFLLSPYINSLPDLLALLGGWLCHREARKPQK